MNYDNLIYTLNHKLRPASEFFITAKVGDNAKEVIKTVAKDLEESNVL